MSELLESLVLQILSLLPTDEAFTTCILSKRWQYLWTSLNSFIFSPKRHWERSKGFRSFVDYVLSHSTASKFDKFELHCSSPHLELSHDFHDFKCSLVDVSSVVNAKITFDITCIKDFEDDYLDSDEEDEDSCRDYHEGFKTLVQDYLQKLRYATELTFGTLFSQVLCILQFKEVPISELECKYLVIELHLEKFSLYGEAGLLRASRLVETLNISIENQPMKFRFYPSVNASARKFRTSHLHHHQTVPPPP
ncbi:hypothetical protein KY284_001188 [Solanum tuberosum]|nr:hypothetical protein KY284_001188 [Solanum tuberosum]